MRPGASCIAQRHRRNATEGVVLFIQGAALGLVNLRDRLCAGRLYAHRKRESRRFALPCKGGGFRGPTCARAARVRIGFYLYKCETGIEKTIRRLFKNMAVALGEHSLVALNQFGIVFTCGQNDAGQLGLGLTPNVDTDTRQRVLLGAI